MPIVLVVVGDVTGGYFGDCVFMGGCCRCWFLFHDLHGLLRWLWFDVFSWVVDVSGCGSLGLWVCISSDCGLSW